MREGFAVFVAVLASAAAASAVSLLVAGLARPPASLDVFIVLLGFLFVMVACFGYSMIVGIPLALRLSLVVSNVGPARQKFASSPQAFDVASASSELLRHHPGHTRLVPDASRLQPPGWAQPRR